MPRVDNEKFYNSALQKHGITAKGVHWFSQETQEIRFDILQEMLPSDLSSCTLADAGCGFGDFYLYLQKKQNSPKKYIGIDALESMSRIARERTKCEIVTADVCKDALPWADYYVCSGAMNILSAFETRLFIRNCYLACGGGFIFNILHGDKQSQTYNYIASSQIKAIAKELKVAAVHMKTDYLQNDITIGFFK